MPNDIISIAAFDNWIKKQTELEYELLEVDLPIFCGDWVHNKQGEYVLLCGMLPQLIWAVIDLNCFKIVANPHLFDDCNSNKSLWISFAQPNFLEQLKNCTNYRFGYSLDGSCYPHLIQPFCS